MRPQHGTIQTGLLLALVSLLAGCGKQTPAPGATGARTDYPLPDPPLVSTCEPGQHGGRLVISTFADPKTFNPITANEQSSLDILRFFFSGLVDYDYTTLSPRPALAESWSVEPDQKTWTFKLRRNLWWSDGHPLTADDVVFTWQVIYDPNIDNVTADAFRIDGKNFEVTKVDDHTIKVITPDIYAPFLIYFGGQAIIPKHILSSAVATTNFASAFGVNTPPEQLVSSGPFKLKEYKPAQHVLLEKNPYFAMTDKNGLRLPYLDNVIFTIVPDMNTMTLRFLDRGESDVLEFVRPDEFEKFKTKAKEGRFAVHDLGPGLEKSFIFFNQNTNANPKTGKPYLDEKKQKWFRNTKFRQAIAHAIDRETIAKNILGGRAVPNYGYVSQANAKWHNSNLVEYPFNLDRSRTLLKEIGIEDRNNDGKLEDAEGNKIEFLFQTISGNPLRESIAVVVISDLKKLGLEVSKQTVDFNKLGDMIRVTRDFDCVLFTLGGGDTDPTSSMNVIKSDGFTHLWAIRQSTPFTDWEARMDYLISAQVKTLDFPTRKKYFDEVQEIMNREQPFIYTVSSLHAAAARSDLKNIRPSVIPSYRLTWNIEELYYQKKP
ncbi:MAG: ABC transporter substrate-binding protein [Verrucomicrobiales bacterium]|nr:ABC transporter substrate-binding protein [Verrucomicrobiales bacterium]